MYLSKIDYDFHLNENRDDHDEYIAEYRTFLGIQIKDGKLVDSIEDKHLAVSIIAYRQLVYCYENLDSTGVNKLTDAHRSDLSLITQRYNALFQSIRKEEKKQITEEGVLNRQILMSFYTGFDENKFTDPDHAYYPQCRIIDVQQMIHQAKHLKRGLLKGEVEGFRNYATLAVVSNQLPKTTETYEDVLR